MNIPDDEREQVRRILQADLERTFLGRTVTAETAGQIQKRLVALAKIMPQLLDAPDAEEPAP